MHSLKNESSITEESCERKDPSQHVSHDESTQTINPPVALSRLQRLEITLTIPCEFGAENYSASTTDPPPAP